jgi:hypothetical protein
MEWDKALIDTSNNTTTILNIPALVKGVYINTALSSHTVIVKDGSESTFTIPANAAAGNFYDWESVRFETSLWVDPDDASTGSFTVLYKDLARND